MFKANGQRKDFPVVGEVTVVGRGEECGLRIPLTDVSRRHCELRIEDNGVVVADLSSSNGTFVNGKKVTESRLRPGDKLTLGPVVFVVQIDGRPATVLPPPPSKQKAVPAAQAVDDSDIVELDVDEDEAIVLEEDDEAAEPASDDDIFSALEAMADDPKKKK